MKKNLSHRETDILQMMVDGKSRKEIATSLNITVRTVQYHIDNIYSKSGLAPYERTREELIKTFGRFEVTLTWVPRVKKEGD